MARTSTRRRRLRRRLRSLRGSLYDAWVRLTVFGVRDTFADAWRRRPLAVGAVALAATTLGFVGVRTGLAGPLGDVELAEPVPAPALPVLPVIPRPFDGVPLEVHLAPPALADHHRDELLGSAVLRDPEFAQAVHWWIDYWTGPASRWFPGFLSRMAERGTTVDSALAMHGFPPSLRYLPLIESGYDPGVTSRSGAVGLWQLMPTTARGLGLHVSSLRDERQHPELSTRAALEYLGSLRGEFDSWFLTLAAYNSGPTRVRGILRRHAPGEPHSDSLFWALRNRFPLETREFVPKLYGAMWVASRPDAYGFGAELEPAPALDD